MLITTPISFQSISGWSCVSPSHHHTDRDRDSESQTHSKIEARQVGGVGGRSGAKGGAEEEEGKEGQGVWVGGRFGAPRTGAPSVFPARASGCG